MNSNLFKAILAMDSYNRGYNQSINLSGTDSIGDKLGNAIVIRESDIANNSGGVNIGFYAIAYDLDGVAGGEKIISYRGTDDFDGAADLFTSKDAAYGWILGGGSTTSSQGKMAV
jgi:hypothetical protein